MRDDTLDPAIAAARTYKGEADYGAHLTHDNFRELIDARNGGALFCAHYSGARKIRDWSFAAFSNAARSLAHRLSDEFNVQPGDRVMVALGNRDAAIIAYAALWGMGATAVLINPAELGDFGVFVSETSGAWGVILAPNQSEHAPDGLFTLELDGKELVDTTAPDWPHAAPARETPAVLIYTSGTTGRCKGVVLDQGNLLINAEATRRLHQLEPGAAHMCVLPMFHVNAMDFSFVTSLYAECKLVLNRSFYPSAFWDIARAENAEIVSMAPAAIRRLTEDKREIGKDVVPDSLRYVTSASAPLSRELLRIFMDRFGVPIHQAYGLSETVNFSLAIPGDIPDAAYRAALLDAERPSAGQAVFGNEITVTDDAGDPLPEGETGEVRIRGWNVMRGYDCAPEANADAFADGWFRTGDRGYWRDLEGRRFYFLAGRLKEIVKRHGQTISLLDIDEALGREGWRDVVAVGFPNTHAEEEIGLFVLGEESEAARQSLTSAFESALPSKRRPSVIVFGDAIPQTSTGKIQRRALIPKFEAYAESRLS